MNTTQVSAPGIQLNDHQRALLNCSLPGALAYASNQWGERVAYLHIESKETLTWRELRERVLRLAAGLHEHGVAHGEKVGVLLQNRVEFLVSWLAIAELGAVIVPLNSKYTTRELQFVVDDAEVLWLIASTDLLENHIEDDKLVGLRPENVFSIPADGSHFGIPFQQLLEHGNDFVSTTSADDLLNIQFTSGTTGLPKGCLLTHRYWLELGAYSAPLFDNPQRLLADHPFYYMQNQAYFAIALASGGAIYVTNGLSRRKFMGWLHNYEIDFAWIDEGMLAAPAHQDDAQIALKRAPVSAIPKDVHAELENRFALKAREWYASTEIGAGTYVPFDRSDLVGSGSMGICFPNRESKIINDRQEPVEAGESGELVVRGSGMMLGYHNRPETNEELFLPGGWFRTGDIVRKTEDGLHYYEGRTRDVVRRSGENIACAEVELQLGTMPQIAEVGVVPVPDPHRGEEVKAIVVLRDDAVATAEDVVAWAKRGLAGFKVPRFIEFRDGLPHTPSGKIKKVDLRGEAPFNNATIDTHDMQGSI